ncbi:WbuC family cupin fold metalloprotein [Propionivibrio dicarboxylicus]|uniref:Cupin fold metalloprotein, WbuC family n=1 Tax=Propionivibrio dicarboxylicus TaxID=83767 RepID=A0A1G8MQY0_9RHOO|nr:WbuC family cupin fold metalloprotein [Propionivibrio dicarboxylicus]SDI69700.1 cupin fold metalloprotein, WbuC family [Propionivibrio dicarboxylicus]
MRQISRDDLAALSAAATASPRRRANLNIHEHLDDPVQRLAIAMEPDTLVLPHRHPHTWELLFPLKGRFIVLYFDDAGHVTHRQILGEESALIETPPGQWHAVLSQDTGGVIFEVKHGPYTPLASYDIHDWRQEDTPLQTRALLDWYARAQIGDRFPD